MASCHSYHGLESGQIIQKKYWLPMQLIPHLILAKQTGCFAPDCKFNVESTDVLLPLSA
jgi:hypothetical protein